MTSENPIESCDQIDLSAFLRGEISELKAEAILEHLQKCPKCEETLVVLERNEQTLASLPTLDRPELPFQNEPAFEEMVRAAKRLAAPESVEPSTGVLGNAGLSSPTSAPSTPNRVEPGSNADLPRLMLRDYQLIEKLGEGGMGSVYRAVHTRLNKVVAVKVLSNKMRHDEATIKRFEREMSIVGQLHHPNIVQAHDAGEDDGLHYLVMELIDGADLASILRHYGSLPSNFACELICQAATGLQYAHQYNLVHRDIKPSNLMLARNPMASQEQSAAIVKIMDLGLARLHDEDIDSMRELTTDGQIMGTMDYMAPEQGNDSHAVDIRADIYSLGATFYKLLSGRTPFAEHAHKPILQRIAALATQDIPPISSLCSDLPPKLDAVVHRMLEKDPDARYQTPADVIAALEPFRSKVDLAALLELKELPRPVSSQSTKARAPKAPATRTAGFGRFHNKRLWIACGGLAAFLLLAVIAIVTRDGRIEITCPDGELPPDLKVVVTQQGEEVQVLQADNHWTARLVNGQYEVEVRGGKDEFEIQSPRLVINRMGKTICVVTYKANAVANAKVDTPRADKTVEKTEGNKNDAMTELKGAKPSAPTTSEKELAANREKPFVLLGPDGKAMEEFRSINEALAVPRPGIIEIYGNGPFKLQQLRRSGGMLHLRAASGFRPRIVTGFALPQNNERLPWMHFQDVELTLEGCDFVGASADQFVLLSGSGGKWNLKRCRLLQPYTRVGSPLAFDGTSLRLEESLIHTPSPTTVIMSVGATPSVQLVRNQLVWGGMMIVVQPKGPQLLELDSNLFFGRSVLHCAPSQEATDAVRVQARNNRFSIQGTLISGTLADLKALSRWQGENNQFTPFGDHPLWKLDSADGTKSIANAADWNNFWQNARDLVMKAWTPPAWDLLASSPSDVTQSPLVSEIAAVRGRVPELANLGPDISRIGGRGTKVELDDKTVTDGGPFLVLRNGKPIASYIGLQDALPHTLDDDIIEVHSDGPFPPVEISAPNQRRLTLRAASGFRPQFERFYADEKSGEWTLIGLDIRGVKAQPAIWCASRLIENCTVGYDLADGRVQLYQPPNSKELMIKNCWFPNSVHAIGVRSTITNSVLGGVTATNPVASAEKSPVGQLSIDHCCIWSHATPSRPTYGLAVGLSSDIRLAISASLIDAVDITIPQGNSHWSGKQNVYRILGESSPTPLSDEQSLREPSAVLQNGF